MVREAARMRIGLPVAYRRVAWVTSPVQHSCKAYIMMTYIVGVCGMRRAMATGTLRSVHGCPWSTAYGDETHGALAMSRRRERERGGGRERDRDRERERDRDRETETERQRTEEGKRRRRGDGERVPVERLLGLSNAITGCPMHAQEVVDGRLALRRLPGGGVG